MRVEDTQQFQRKLHIYFDLYPTLNKWYGLWSEKAWLGRAPGLRLADPRLLGRGEKAWCTAPGSTPSREGREGLVHCPGVKGRIMVEGTNH